MCLAGTAPGIAQDGDSECPICDLWEDLADLYDKASDAKDFYTNYTECRGAGHSEETCLGATGICAVQSQIPLGSLGVVGSFYEGLGLDQLFKVNCGDGVCFACCKIDGGGCGSSFHEGEDGPPINCNPDLVPGARIVGNTLLLDNTPGKPCLSTPQLCIHIPICAAGSALGKMESPVDEIDDINNDPNHPIKLQRAKERRRRDYAEQAGKAWMALLREVSTRAVDPDTLGSSPLTLRDLRDFATGRGCTTWRPRLRKAAEDFWGDPLLAVLDEDSLGAPEASHLLGLYQLGLRRFLAGLPNHVARVDSVESWIWKEDARQAYLSQIGNPDQVLLDQMGPVGLEILRRIPMLQDYRLLAVPMPDEFTDPGFFNGCELGQPPVVTLSQATGGDPETRVRVVVTNADNPSAPVPIAVMWGDGSISRHEIAPGAPGEDVAHSYSRGGQYQVYVVAENESGLRGVAGIPVQAVAGGSPLSDQSASPSLVRLVDAAVFNRFRSAAGTLHTSVSVEAAGADGGHVEIGVSQASWGQPSVAGDLVALGSIDGHLPAGASVSRIRVRQSLAKAGSFNPEAFFYTSALELHVFDTGENRTVPVIVPIEPTWVRLYRFDSEEPDLITAPVYDDGGRLGIPLSYDRYTPYRHAEILLPDSLLDEAGLGPVEEAAWSGVSGSWVEITPDRFSSADVIVSHTELQSAPATYTLEQNYPNPFAESSTIRFTLTRPAVVRLHIYDLLGRPVAKLLDGPQSAGTTEVPVSASALPSGVYFYRMDVGGVVTSRRMAVVR